MAHEAPVGTLVTRDGPVLFVRRFHNKLNLIMYPVVNSGKILEIHFFSIEISSFHSSFLLCFPNGDVLVSLFVKKLNCHRDFKDYCHENIDKRTNELENLDLKVP